MKKLMKLAAKVSTVLAAMAMFVATSSVSTCCHRWFAQPVEPEELRKLQPPCIIHWNFNHCVVFEGFKGKYAYINDPALGRRKLSAQELDDAFTTLKANGN